MEEPNGGECESWLCHLLAVGPDTNYLTSLHPQSLICRGGLPSLHHGAVLGIVITELHLVRALSQVLCLCRLGVLCEDPMREALSSSPLPGGNTGHRAVR